MGKIKEIDKEKRNAYMREWNRLHPDKVKLTKKKEYEKNKERYLAHNKQYYKKNKKQILIDTKEWTKNNPEKRKEIERKYRLAHADKTKKRVQAWHFLNKEKIKKQQKEYRTNNKEKIKTIGKIYRITHKEYLAAKDKKYREEYPEKTRERQQVRRARKRKVFVEKVSILEICERDQWVCQLCGEKVRQELRWPHPFSASLDHITSIVSGGEHSKANAQLAHLRCNQSAGAKRKGA